MQIAVFKMLTDAEGETAKIEKEKKCLMEIYMLFSNPVEIHTVKLYISNCNIRQTISLRPDPTLQNLRIILENQQLNQGAMQNMFDRLEGADQDIDDQIRLMLNDNADNMLGVRRERLQRQYAAALARQEDEVKQKVKQIFNHLWPDLTIKFIRDVLTVLKF